MQSNKILREFRSSTQESLIDQFRKLDKEIIGLASKNEQSITIELVSHDRMQQYDNQQGTIVPSQASLSEDQDDGKPIERNNEGEISSVEEKQEAIRQEKMNVYQDPDQMSSETEARTEQVRRLFTGDGADEAVKMANRRKRAETKAEQRRLDEETE